MSPPLHAVVDTICRDLCSDGFPSGDRAALRRMRAPGDDPLTLWRCLGRWEVDPMRDDELAAWTDILALLSAGADTHAPKRLLGQALAEAGVSEQRLLRLMRAEPDGFAAQARSILHLLQSKGVSADLTPLAELRLPISEERRETVCRHLASTFYRNAPKE